jgi:SagB-type dehydrogenase family enzyme
MDISKIGDNFLQQTKYVRGKLSGGPLNWRTKPKTYKKYQNVPIFTLPKITELDNVIESQSLLKILNHRRSIRQYDTLALNDHQLAYLLWASTGISREVGNFQFRTAPSAGALYPIETYLCINEPIIALQMEMQIVIPKGIYHYNILNHTLEQLLEGDYHSQIAYAALDQQIAALAPVVFIWTAIFQRSKWKYKQRAYRYIFLDAGHIAAHLSLAATDIDLGTCQIAAFYDEEINSLLNIDGIEESGIYLSVLGHPRTISS